MCLYKKWPCTPSKVFIDNKKKKYLLAGIMDKAQHFSFILCTFMDFVSWLLGNHRRHLLPSDSVWMQPLPSLTSHVVILSSGKPRSLRSPTTSLIDQVVMKKGWAASLPAHTGYTPTCPSATVATALQHKICFELTVWNCVWVCVCATDCMCVPIVPSLLWDMVWWRSWWHMASRLVLLVLN